MKNNDLFNNKKNVAFNNQKCIILKIETVETTETIIQEEQDEKCKKTVE